MSEPFIGTIQAFGFNFPPRGWQSCAGQLLSISQYTAVFSLLGTQFGGDGRVTFGLPDLQGRVALNQGQGPGLSNYTIGEQGGVETTTLTINQMPMHNHLVSAKSAAGASATAAGNILASAQGFDPTSGDAVNVQIYGPAPGDVTMSPQAIGLAGGSQPVSLLQPFLVVNFSIALEGIFPSRN